MTQASWLYSFVFLSYKSHLMAWRKVIPTPFPTDITTTCLNSCAAPWLLQKSLSEKLRLSGYIPEPGIWLLLLYKPEKLQMSLVGTKWLGLAYKDPLWCLPVWLLRAVNSINWTCIFTGMHILWKSLCIITPLFEMKSEAAPKNSSGDTSLGIKCVWVLACSDCLLHPTHYSLLFNHVQAFHFCI